jgi:hypothetical protein
LYPNYQININLNLHLKYTKNFITPIKNNWSQFHLQIGTKKSSEQKAQEVHTLICKGAVPLHPTILQDFLKLIAAL